MCAAVLTAILSVGCSQSDNGDDPDMPDFEEGIPTEVTITLSARSGNGTRAEESPTPYGTPKDPTSSVELMHDDWWIVFIDKKNTVRIIGQKDKDVTDRVKSVPSSVDDPDGFEAETFKIILPSGTYRVYAFANVPQKTAEQFEAFRKENSNPWKHGTVHLKDILGSDKFITDPDGSEDDGMQWPSDKNIPLTGVMPEVVIKNTVEEAFNIEVIRAVAKVEFAFSNSTTETITLKKLEFSPISKCGKISFVPNNDVLGFGPNNKLITDKVDTGILSFGLNSELTAADPSYNFVFYCNESLPHDQEEYNKNQNKYDVSKTYTDLYTQHFTIKLTVDKNGVPQPERTLYTNKITYINRNDWIKIPISFTDWIIQWRMHYYPPIGGYPPLFEQSNDGENVEILATTAGEFEIFPDIFENGNEYTLNATEWGNVKIDSAKIKETDLDGNDLPAGKSLFVVSPTKQTAKGTVANKDRYYIAGELSNVEGIATIKVEFMLSAGPYANQLKTCTFTITRKNGTN